MKTPIMMMSLVAGLLTLATAVATPAEARHCFDQGAYNRQMAREQRRIAYWQNRQARRNARFWNQNPYGYNNGYGNPYGYNYNRGFLSRFF